MSEQLTTNQSGTKQSNLLEIREISKSFPGVIALDRVSFDLKRGTVHALMGENGAGKSTLMKIIAGIYSTDSGEIRLNGEAIKLNAPIDALKRGIAMIHQELNLMPFMTVAENVWITREPLTRFGFVDHKELNRRTAELFARLSIPIDPELEVQTLSVANRQMVEIAKAVSYNSQILIMDEPTSALTEREVDHLFRIIRDLKKQGKGIVYITHKMNELFEIADEVSVFRDGRHIDTKPIADLTRDQIIRLMVGRELTQLFPKGEAKIGETRLEVENLTLKGIFNQVSFAIRAGEILGVWGLVGSGRSNVAEALFGVVPADSGTIKINGKLVNLKNPATAMENHLAFLTEDRTESGCFLNLDIAANMGMAVLRQGYVSGGFVKAGELNNDLAKMVTSLKIKTPSLWEIIENLSGGNQQKVLVGRWLLTKPQILILDEPTRGIDVGAKAEIYKLVSKLAAEGVAVLMISSELPEVLGMSDRIMVMHEGRVAGIVSPEGMDQVKIMQLATR